MSPGLAFVLGAACMGLAAVLMFWWSQRPKTYRINVPYEPTWTVPEWANTRLDKVEKLDEHRSKRRSERAENHRIIQGFADACSLMQGKLPTKIKFKNGSTIKFKPTDPPDQLRGSSL